MPDPHVAHTSPDVPHPQGTPPILPKSHPVSLFFVCATAFHIRKGHTLTMLVSHANAEDLGIVLAFWSWILGSGENDAPALEALLRG